MCIYTQNLLPTNFSFQQYAKFYAPKNFYVYDNAIIFTPYVMTIQTVHWDTQVSDCLLISVLVNSK